MTAGSRLLAAFCYGAGLCGMCAQTPPPYTPLVWDQDWSYLADPAQALDWSDRWKHVNLFGTGAYVSVGGQIRERGEYQDNPGWGAQGHDNGYLLQRYLFHADWHFTNGFRVFVQAGSSLENGREGGPRPNIDQSKLYLNQAFIEYTPADFITLRVGRQLVPLGSSRLFAIGAGLNVQQPFDGARVTLRPGRWNVDLFGLRPSLVREETWGIYAYRPFPLLPRARIDLYYIGLEHKATVWAQGAGREQRESFGTRLSARSPTWYYDFEYTAQLGRFGAGNIRAWGAGYNAGYHFARRWTPKIELDGGIVGGDRNLHDHTLGTFNPLFPNGSYLSQSQLIGPYNVVIVRPKLELALTPKLTFSPNLEFLWRQSLADGIYNIAGFLTHTANGSTQRYIGGQLQAETDYAFTRHLTGALVYEHFFPGGFLKQVPLNRNLNFFSPQLTYTF